MRTPFSSNARFLIVLLLWLTAACATPGPPRPMSVCGTPDFPYTGGWLGGDAAYSVPLGEGESLWLFGDSFVGSPELETRVGSTFVHNTIGLSRCARSDDWKIEYFWTTATEGAPARAFVETGDSDRFHWLFDGFVHEGVLYLGLLSVEMSKPRGPLNMPFRFSGMGLARVANFRRPPAEWVVEILPLSTSSRAIPGSSLVVHGEYLYLFTFIDEDATHYPRMLARVPLSALDERPTSLPDAVESLARDGQWRAGLDIDQAAILMDDDASEMSVRFHADIGRWVAVYGYPSLRPGFPEVAPSDEIVARTALRLEGPWSAPRTIHHIAELAPGRARDPNTFCYAAKEHPELARQGELLITYVCNLFTPVGDEALPIMQRLFVAMDLYRPVVVTVPIDEVLGRAR